MAHVYKLVAIFTLHYAFGASLTPPKTEQTGHHSVTLSGWPCLGRLSSGWQDIFTRVTRTLFTLGELTLGDPDYTGPHFDIDKIAKDVNDKASFVWIHCDNLYKKSWGNWGNFGLTFATSSVEVSYGTITRPNRSDPYFSSCVFSPKHRNFQDIHNIPNFQDIQNFQNLHFFYKISKIVKISKWPIRITWHGWPYQQTR